MNKERIAAMAEFIESLPEKRFTMQSYGFGPTVYSNVYEPDIEYIMGSDCGTAGCIAGWTLLKYYGVVKNNMPPTTFAAATKILDLADDEANYLFMGYWSRKTLANIKKDETVAHLRSLVNE